MERTLLILKPDGVVRQHVGAKVLEQVLRLECEVRKFGTVRPLRRFLADDHYYMHKGKSFFEWLLDFMTCTNLIVVVLEGSDIIRRVRETIGPTRVEEAVVKAPRSLRARYGMFGGVNLVHASDSSVSASREIRQWSSIPDVRENDALQEVKRYISENIDRPYVDTLQYRNLVKEMTQSPGKLNETTKEIVRLLRRENNSLGVTDLEHFTEVILAAV